MGNVPQKVNLRIEDKEDRRVFVVFKAFRKVMSPYFGTYIVFSFVIRYLRFKWEVDIRFNELVKLDRALMRQYPTELNALFRPNKVSKVFWSHDDIFLNERAKSMNKYLQDLLDIAVMIDDISLRMFLGASAVSFVAEVGRKGKEGWLKKCSGGYVEKFSRKTGDYINLWKWRWIVLTDAGISWFKTPHDVTALGFLRIDQDLTLFTVGRVVTVHTATRKISFFASTTKAAIEWTEEIRQFYNGLPRVSKQYFDSSYPPRLNCHVKAYTTGKEYMEAVTIAILGAQKEIMITSWKNSPHCLVTRPPMPPLRLDQLLKFKADQGVKIYVLLYKEVENIGQGNDSAGVRKSLMSLSPNIHCIRHPNKFIGGSTAFLWSHHEKLVIVDRNAAFVGGIDIAYNRWDDELHRVVDEDGLLYPGHDYRQPAANCFKAVPNADRDKEANDSDEEMIEVEVATPGENLPVAVSSPLDEDESPVEVDVVVDFGMAESQYQPDAVAQNNQIPQRSDVAQNNMPVPSPPQTSAPRRAPVPGEEEEQLSDEDNNWAEDQNEACSPDELKALQGGGHDDLESVMDDPQHMRNSSYGEVISRVQRSTSSFYSSVSSSVMTYSEQAQSMFQNYRERVKTTKRLKKSGYWEVRDIYPRMGWHDLHAAISGAAVRDVASHFVQRWNHHRLSTAQYDTPVLSDITDDLYVSSCPKCEKTGIFELATHCPNCNYDLGPVNSFSRPISIEMIPPHPSNFSYCTYECYFFMSSKLPFRMQGDCPVILTSIVSPVVEEIREFEGVAIDRVGPMGEWLQAFGLFPAIGDVIVAVNGATVSHLNSNQIKRFVKRIKKGVSTHQLEGMEGKFSITFRRHYLQDLYPTDKVREDPVVATMEPIPSKNPDAVDPSLAKIQAHDDTATNPFAPEVSMSHEEHVMSVQQYNSTLIAEEQSLDGITRDGINNADPMLVTVAVEEVVVSPTQLAAQSNLPSSPGRNPNAFHPACKAAAQKEIQLSMSRVYHEFSRLFELVPRIPDEQGTCKVQILRSVGKWSIGTKPEISIMNCYLETILHAHRFIYIENQFFIGNQSDDVQNSIPLALCDRILKAYAAKEPFRVIIVIPIHPNGDFLNSMKAKVVMHYEYATINRGVKSLIQTLKKKAPGISVQDYIGFFSLRNWGVLNNKVVSEQIYVHDKLIIADDRVAIIGSANINDRSMLGARDSEVAIRVEDTFHVQSTLNGQPHTVGFFPHMLRMKLMRQHLADQNFDILDPLDVATYTRWCDISNRNSTIYDELDGSMSIYRCNTIAQFKGGLDNYIHKSILDPDVKESLSQIKGFIVDWPQNLFQKEDLSPSLATRALIPNDLWV